LPDAGVYRAALSARVVGARLFRVTLRNPFVLPEFGSGTLAVTEPGTRRSAPRRRGRFRAPVAAGRQIRRN